MTAITNSTTPSAPVSFEVLLAKMLPHFRYYAKRCSRSKRFDRDDVVQDLAGIALDFYTSLVRQGKEVFYSPLVRYSIKRYKSGRRFTGLNSTDILSEHAQLLGRSHTCQLSEFDDQDADCMEDLAVNVVNTVQFSVDYESWFSKQVPRDQQIITDLSYGYTTGEAAKKYGVSPGLISQYRKRYRDDWNDFMGNTSKPV